MKKLNVSFIDNGTKEDAVLKIKDDSFSITTNDNSIIKIPYSDVKDYDYSQDERLTIKRKHSSDIVIEVSFDTTLINTLKEIVKNNETHSQPTYDKKDNQIEESSKNIAQSTSNENINISGSKPLVHSNATSNNSGNHSNIGSIIITIIVLLFAGIFIFNTFFNSEDNNNENESPKTEDKTPKTDKMVGTWYSYDKYGLKEHDSYIVIDGEGNFYNVIGNYSFYKGSGIYNINGEKVIFYSDSSKNYEWNSCTLQTNDKMFCVQKGGSGTYYQR